MSHVRRVATPDPWNQIQGSIGRKTSKDQENGLNLMEHGGEQRPNFNMKARKYFRTALARQVAEAVLIRRRGWMVWSQTNQLSQLGAGLLGSNP